MSIFHDSALIGSGGGAVAYQINQSLRFNSADSAYLNRTPASEGNRKTWTWSGWVKYTVKNNTSTYNQPLFWASSTGTSGISFSQDPNAAHRIYVYNAGWNIETTQFFRDPSSWYHIVAVIDTTQATASNRTKLYVNGVQVTDLASASYPVQNAGGDINNTTEHNIGKQIGLSRYFDGYLAEVNFIDGQALTPSSFGETDTITGAWIPKKYSGSYGTNGFYLKFADNSGTTSTTLGKDSSGNGNNWTPNNFSVTAGAGNDVLSDTPTTNWCTFNPLCNPGPNGTAANGNLDISSTATTSGSTFTATFPITNQGSKWYWEYTVGTVNSGYPILTCYPTAYTGDNVGGGYLGMNASGTRYNADGTSTASALPGYTTNDVCMFAYDPANGKIWMGKNGTWFLSGDPAAGTNPIQTATTAQQALLFPAVSLYNGASCVANFGQRSFSYTPPTGYKALNTANLPEPTIKKGSAHFNTVLYTGTGSSLAVTGVGFQPDFIWFKNRSNAASHSLVNQVTDAYLSSDLTDAESAATDLTYQSDGFTHTASSSRRNTSSQTYVAWNWKADNTNGSSNTAGTITSTVSANATAGFSIVTYSGNGTAGATVGHGLGVAPKMIIPKSRTGTAPTNNWHCYHASLGATQGILLNSTNAAATDSGYWNNTAPTSSVITLGTYNSYSGQDYVAYCFSEVAGYSKFGSYTGNGSSDGPFVFCGFRPRWIMIKRTDSSSGADWGIHDSSRSLTNPTVQHLNANVSDAEGIFTSTYNDFLSNGFKIRGTDAYHNFSGGTYIFAAFAEHPFKYSNAR